MKRFAFLFALLIPLAANAGAGVAAAGAPVKPAAAVGSVSAPIHRLSEQQKIEALIAAIEHLPGAVFIRNGSEYNGERAAAHLRLKWHNAGSRVKTAEDFIAYCASESSMSGKKYRIRFADGHSVDSADYFHQQLRSIEAQAGSGVARAR